jgi:hypothetical protein
MKKTLFKRLAVIAAATTGLSAFAVGPDLTPLTAAVDPGTTVTGILTVAGSLVLIYLAMMGAKKVLSMIRG